MQGFASSRDTGQTTGTGREVRETSPTLTTPTLGVATATSVNKVAITAPATGSTLTIPDGVTFTGPASSGTAMTLGNAESVTGAKTFDSSALKMKESGGGSDVITIAAPSIAANTTVTLPSTTGTLALTSDITGGTKTYCVFSAKDGIPPATNYATRDTRNSIPVLDFDDTTEESTYFIGVIPNGASLGSGLKVTLHFMATSATTGNARWGVAFEATGTDLDADSFDTATESTVAISGTSGIETALTITCTTIDSVAAQNRFRLKVYRDVTDAADTVTGDLELVSVEVWSAA